MANWGGGLSGAAAGAGAGAAFGPIGAGIGGLGGLIAGLFSGNKDKIRQIQQLLPEQKEALLRNLQQLQQMEQPGGNYAQSQDYLGNMLSGSPEAYERFAAPHMTQFQEQTIPRLAERFAGLGGGLGGGALSSSGFGQAVGGAANQFQSNLAGLYAQLQQQAAQQAMGQYNTLQGYGLGTQAFQPAYQQGSPGFGPTALSGLAQGAGSAFGQQFGNNLSSRFLDMFNQNKTQQNTSQLPVR